MNFVISILILEVKNGQILFLIYPCVREIVWVYVARTYLWDWAFTQKCSSTLLTRGQLPQRHSPFLMQAKFTSRILSLGNQASNQKDCIDLISLGFSCVHLPKYFKFFKSNLWRSLKFLLAGSQYKNKTDTWNKASPISLLTVVSSADKWQGGLVCGNIPLHVIFLRCCKILKGFA